MDACVRFLQVNHVARPPVVSVPGQLLELLDRGLAGFGRFRRLLLCRLHLNLMDNSFDVNETHAQPARMMQTTVETTPKRSETETTWWARLSLRTELPKHE